MQLYAKPLHKPSIAHPKSHVRFDPERSRRPPRSRPSVRFSPGSDRRWRSRGTRVRSPTVQALVLSHFFWPFSLLRQPKATANKQTRARLAPSFGVGERELHANLNLRFRVTHWQSVGPTETSRRGRRALHKHFCTSTEEKDFTTAFSIWIQYVILISLWIFNLNNMIFKF